MRLAQAHNTHSVGRPGYRMALAAMTLVVVGMACGDNTKPGDPMDGTFPPETGVETTFEVVINTPDKSP